MYNKKLKTNYMKNKEYYIINRTKNIIMVEINKYYSSRKAFKTKQRKREYVFARQLYMYFMKKHTTLSLDLIGESFEINKSFNHATILHGIKTINNLIETDKILAYNINKIAGNIFNKTKSIVLDIEKNRYYIDLNYCFSAILNNGKSIVLSGYSKDEAISTFKGLYGENVKVTEHNNTNMYLIEN